MLLQLSAYGKLSRTVHPNLKCDGCLHFEANKSLSGACVVGLQPANCGDTGAMPLVAYAPFGPRPAENALEGVTKSLGEEHEPLLRSIISDFARVARSGCRVHADDAPSFEGYRCSCGSIARSLVAERFWKLLPNRTKAVTTAEQLGEFIERAMTPVSPSPGAAKKPPTYLPGVHSPDSPMRPGKKKTKPATAPAVSAPVAKSDDEEDGLAALEALGAEIAKGEEESDPSFAPTWEVIRDGEVVKGASYVKAPKAHPSHHMAGTAMSPTGETGAALMHHANAHVNSGNYASPHQHKLAIAAKQHARATEAATPGGMTSGQHKAQARWHQEWAGHHRRAAAYHSYHEERPSEGRPPSLSDGGNSKTHEVMMHVHEAMQHAHHQRALMMDRKKAHGG